MVAKVILSIGYGIQTLGKLETRMIHHTDKPTETPSASEPGMDELEAERAERERLKAWLIERRHQEEGVEPDRGS